MTSSSLAGPPTLTNAEYYDRSRAGIPPSVVKLLTASAGAEAPVVVDLGAGTGLSSLVWLGRASRIVAVEPDRRMRVVLEERAATLDPADRERLTVLDTNAEETGLPAGGADIVTACHALHWFDADRALAEAARLLRPGGVFAIVYSSMPFFADWTLQAAFQDVRRRVEEAKKIHGPGRSVPAEDSENHMQMIEGSGRFRHSREVALHGTETGDGRRLVELACTMGGFRLMKAGMSEDELGLTRLRELAHERMAEPCTWWWTFRVCMGQR